jgi:hypothetical protein
MRYEIRYIYPKSVLFSAVPVVLFIMGLFYGAMMFFLSPAETYAGMSFSSRVAAALFYALTTSIGLYVAAVVVSLLYNFVCYGLGCRGVQIHIEDADTEAVQETESA